MRASDGAGRRRGRRANPEGGGGGGGGGEGTGRARFSSRRHARHRRNRGDPGDVSSRRGARTRHRSWGSSGPNYREARERRVCDGAGRRGEGREVRDGRWGMRRGKGEGRMGGRPSPSPPHPPGGPEKIRSRWRAAWRSPRLLQRRCLGAASGRDAIERARRRDTASRRGAAAAPRRPNAGRGEEVARTRRDADPARSASPARRALRLRAKCRALAAGIARGRGTRGRGAPSAALDRFAGGFGRYVFEPRGCVVNVWRPRARAPSVDGRENRLALFRQKASLHRGSRSIRPARDPLDPGRRPIASTGENDAMCRVRARVAPPPTSGAPLHAPGALSSLPPPPRAPPGAHGTARPRSCVCAFALARP